MTNPYAIQGWGAPGKAWSTPATRKPAKALVDETATALAGQTDDWLRACTVIEVADLYRVQYQIARRALARVRKVRKINPRAPRPSAIARKKVHCKRWPRPFDGRSKSDHKRPVCNGARGDKESVDVLAFRALEPAMQCKACRTALGRLDDLARLGYPNTKPPGNPASPEIDQ